jgi:hypothetical protein
MTDRDLTLVGVDEDGTTLVLADASGEKFALPVDQRLRSLVHPGKARFGATDDHLEIKMESALRPRDIQARIRAGESPETVAAAAQTTLDKVMGYATPVLAERAHIAERAQRASVRRKSSEGPSQLLGDAVAGRLRDRNIDPESVAWDAWRREDGRWTLVADYRSGESARHAEFVFDAPGRYVVAEDDEARWLVGEQSGHKGPQPRGTAPSRRLSAVGSDDELPLGEDAIGMISADRADPDEETTTDLTRAARAVRGQDPVAQASTADADWIATQASERPAGRDPEPEVEATVEPQRKQSRKNRRASVPSWDEIMFGGERRE